MMNDRLLKALSCTNKGRPPVWLMRQAGRYMPEYRALRGKFSFMEMCHRPELIAEVTLLPIKAFQVDAAILFSDILLIIDALGLGLRFEEGVGPIIERPLRQPSDISELPSISIEQTLGFVKKGIQFILPQLNVPLIGFCGGPFTVASYMIEGGSSRDLRATKQWMIKEPSSFHQLLDKITNDTVAYLNMQIDAGVQALQIFDSWAHVLSSYTFQEFSLRYLQRIIQGLKNPSIPVIIFCRGSSVFAESISKINPSAISLDWNADVVEMRKRVPPHIALQGNLDPDLLYGSSAMIKKEVERLLTGMRGDPGYIFNLGHGIHPDTPYDAVRTLVDTVCNS